MSEADKMFKKLRYNKFEGLRTIDYSNKYGEFQFSKDTKYIHINKCEITDFITMQELEAIYLKCKELGWLDE